MDQEYTDVTRDESRVRERVEVREYEDDPLPRVRACATCNTPSQSLDETVCRRCGEPL